MTNALTKEQQEKILIWAGWEYRECNPNHPQLKNTEYGMGWFHPNHTCGYVKMPDLNDLNLLMGIVENKVTNKYNLSIFKNTKFMDWEVYLALPDAKYVTHTTLGKTLIEALQQTLLKLTEVEK